MRPALLLAAAALTSAAAKPPPHAANPFSVATWATLETGHPSLIRAAPPMDLSAHDSDSDTNVTVYAKKKLPDLTYHNRADGDEPGVGEGMEPFTVPIGPPTDCASTAYQTIGGQAATGADLVGALGGGRC